MDNDTSHPVFAKQPAWNSFAALGFIVGIIFGFELPGDYFWFPALQPYQTAWVTTVIAGSIVGTMVGATVGAFVDFRSSGSR